jgi:hypothetical protein
LHARRDHAPQTSEASEGFTADPAPVGASASEHDDIDTTATPTPSRATQAPENTNTARAALAPPSSRASVGTTPSGVDVGTPSTTAKVRDGKNTDSATAVGEPHGAPRRPLKLALLSFTLTKDFEGCLPPTCRPRRVNDIYLEVTVSESGTSHVLHKRRTEGIRLKRDETYHFGPKGPRIERQEGRCFMAGCGAWGARQRAAILDSVVSNTESDNSGYAVARFARAAVDVKILVFEDDKAAREKSAAVVQSGQAMANIATAVSDLSGVPGAPLAGLTQDALRAVGPWMAINADDPVGSYHATFERCVLDRVLNQPQTIELEGGILQFVIREEA